MLTSISFLSQLSRKVMTLFRSNVSHKDILYLVYVRVMFYFCIQRIIPQEVIVSVNIM